MFFKLRYFDFGHLQFKAILVYVFIYCSPELQTQNPLICERYPDVDMNNLETPVSWDMYHVPCILGHVPCTMYPGTCTMYQVSWSSIDCSAPHSLRSPHSAGPAGGTQGPHTVQSHGLVLILKTTKKHPKISRLLPGQKRFWGLNVAAFCNVVPLNCSAIFGTNRKIKSMTTSLFFSIAIE